MLETIAVHHPSINRTPSAPVRERVRRGMVVTWGRSKNQYLEFRVSICKHAGLGGGLVLSLIWMFVLRLFCGVMVWLTILLANLCFIACTVFSYAKAGDISASSKLGAVRTSSRDLLHKLISYLALQCCEVV